VASKHNFVHIIALDICVLHRVLHECGKITTLHHAPIHNWRGSLPFYLLSSHSSEVLEHVLDARLYAESMGNSGIQHPIISC